MTNEWPETHRKLCSAFPLLSPELRSLSEVDQEREAAIDALPEKLIEEAKRELSFDEKFLALPTNAQQDEEIFSLALEMQRLREAVAKTEKHKTLDEYKSEAA